MRSGSWRTDRRCRKIQKACEKQLMYGPFYVQLDAKKAAGLDGIPCKLLKLSSSIVGPSLAYIFKSCIEYVHGGHVGGPKQVKIFA